MRTNGKYIFTVVVEVVADHPGEVWGELWPNDPNIDAEITKCRDNDGDKAKETWDYRHHGNDSSDALSYYLHCMEAIKKAKRSEKMDSEERHRGEETRKFLEKHKDADYLVVDTKTKEPVEAQYFNKTSLAYQRAEVASFFAGLELKTGKQHQENRC